ncbi:EAL domain-containing protein [Sulfurospirillum sp. T05]|uniref:EAL domain-containing protein n=1 Tax=Sulfurospirillum tamanense TaxID=2813362 RepID=A0ABS2WQ75_9BACT|nr:EAL domain-containing protein [Sulfurospirillum tamanensis]MBN2963799.1 EAL domain-containing protein [Sulfurospirillum tamanensis]
MSCSKCNEIFCLDETPANIFWLCESEELSSKIESFLNALGYPSHFQNGALHVKVENPKDFFETHTKALDEAFNTLAKQAIMVYINAPDEPFSYRSVFLAKPLERYVNLIQDSEFFDIINTESLTSHFQPIVRANSHTIYGYEALIRGVKSDGSLLYPDMLFHKSKRNDLDFKLDRLCRESALKTAAVKKIRQHVFINFLPTAIYDPAFCLKSTIKWANQLEFDPSKIVFEVVETELVADQEHLKTILKFYRGQGYKIALDDVGEGHSNLNMLIELKPDIIKIDRKIIQNIHTDSFKQSVYKALATVAKDHGIKILAEGVETREELDTVQDIGTDYIQGYYFSKPQAEPIRKLYM